ncbi:MAG: hypothetical protein AAGI90_00270 [Chlamydiota bacterium]
MLQQGSDPITALATDFKAPAMPAPNPHPTTPHTPTSYLDPIYLVYDQARVCVKYNKPITEFSKCLENMVRGNPQVLHKDHPSNYYGALLDLAATNRNSQYLEKLLEKGANPNTKLYPYTRDTLLTLSLKKADSTATACLLLEHGAQLMYPDLKDVDIFSRGYSQKLRKKIVTRIKEGSKRLEKMPANSRDINLEKLYLKVFRDCTWFLLYHVYSQFYRHAPLALSSRSRVLQEDLDEIQETIKLFLELISLAGIYHPFATYYHEIKPKKADSKKPVARKIAAPPLPAKLQELRLGLWLMNRAPNFHTLHQKTSMHATMAQPSMEIDENLEKALYERMWEALNKLCSSHKISLEMYTKALKVAYKSFLNNEYINLKILPFSILPEVLQKISDIFPKSDSPVNPNNPARVLKMILNTIVKDNPPASNFVLWIEEFTKTFQSNLAKHPAHLQKVEKVIANRVHNTLTREFYNFDLLLGIKIIRSLSTLDTRSKDDIIIQIERRFFNDYSGFLEAKRITSDREPLPIFLQHNSPGREEHFSALFLNLTFSHFPARYFNTIFANLPTAENLLTTLKFSKEDLKPLEASRKTSSSKKSVKTSRKEITVKDLLIKQFHPIVFIRHFWKTHYMEQVAARRDRTLGITQNEERLEKETLYLEEKIFKHLSACFKGISKFRSDVGINRVQRVNVHTGGNTFWKKSVSCPFSFYYSSCLLLANYIDQKTLRSWLFKKWESLSDRRKNQSQHQIFMSEFLKKNGDLIKYQTVIEQSTGLGNSNISRILAKIITSYLVFAYSPSLQEKLRPIDFSSLKNLPREAQVLRRYLFYPKLSLKTKSDQTKMDQEDSKVITLTNFHQTYIDTVFIPQYKEWKASQRSYPNTTTFAH